MYCHTLLFVYNDNETVNQEVVWISPEQRWEKASQSQLKKVKKTWVRDQFKKESQMEREVSDWMMCIVIGGDLLACWH